MKKWEVTYKGGINITDSDFSGLLDILLKNRDIHKKDIDAFLHPTLEAITLDSVGIDKRQLNKALKRIHAAIKQKEKIIVYGDYDVDGITGTAILWETLHGLKANVMPYIPHRVDEGYGLSEKGITNVLQQHPDLKLIITVDNGIVASSAVDFANSKNVEVIITDHHVSADGVGNLPQAFSIVHTTKLCGAGVAWVLAGELKKQFNVIASGEKQSHIEGIATSPAAPRNDNLEEDNHLELAALGTIADLVPLTGANRAIVKHGLKKLCSTERKGLLALFKEAGCDQNALGVYQVGHVIAPRLNATGRMESAMDSLRLLCTKDDKRAYELAASLGRINKERQQVMFNATEHASLTLKGRNALKKLLIVADKKYPEGVIGLVAGRLVEEYYRPAIVIAKGEKVSKGSVRSVNGFNIIEFLRNSSEYFVNVGGHPMAAGFTIETEKLEAFQKALEDMAEGILDDTRLTRTLRVDTIIPFSFISTAMYHALQSLAPFGMGNPEPTFLSEKVEIKDIRQLGKEGKHLKLMLQQDYGPILEAVAFGMGELYESYAAGDIIDVVYTVDENSWNGQTKLQLKLKDMKKTEG